MKTKTKIWLITAASLILIGCIIFGGVMSMLKWDFSKLSTNKYETNNYEINEEYRNISIISNTADITFVPSESANTTVVCHEHENLKHSVTVKDGTLVVEIVDGRKWHEYIGINFGTQKITVSIPQGEYGALLVKSSTGDIEIPKDFTFESVDISLSTGDISFSAASSGDVKIKTSTGSIRVESKTAGSLVLTASTGKITASDITCTGDVSVKVSTGKSKLSNIECQNLTSSGNTGDITLKNVVAAGMFSIKRSTGDVKLNDSDAAEIFVKTDTGDVTGSLLSEKVFITETDTGTINVPKTVSGGKCEIHTDTGDISITVK